MKDLSRPYWCQWHSHH